MTSAGSFVHGKNGSALSLVQPDAVVLMGHGSRDAAAADEFLALTHALVEAPAMRELLVASGWLEFAGGRVDSIQDAFEGCIGAGARRIAGVPLILFAAGHGSEDMPAHVRLAQRRWPALDIRQAEIVGIDDRLLGCLAERVRTATRDLPPLPIEQIAVLLVTSGSKHRVANADVYKAARLLSDHLDGINVEVAFLRLARPFVQDGLKRCALLGARRVVVVPLFLNTGLLARRVPRKLVWLRRQFSDLELIEVEHLGVEPALVDVLVQRAVAAFALDDAPVRTPVHVA